MIGRPPVSGPRKTPRLLLFTLGPYAFDILLAFFCAALGILAWEHAVYYSVAMASLAILFVGGTWRILIRYWSEPTITMVHMMASIVPALFLMYYMEHWGGRVAFLMLALVPLTFGILTLNRRRFLIVAGFNVICYAILVEMLRYFRPDHFDTLGDTLMVVALVGVVVQISFVGGYIYELRQKLRLRTEELHGALTKISEMAMRDDLTELFNRRYLMKTLQTEISRVSRIGQQIAVCMIDIDHFKRVNDGYGHGMGDAVLKRIGCHIQQNLRAPDSFGRYGGEEFLLLMPQTPLQGAMTKVERLRREIETLSFEDLVPGLRMTISLGVSVWREGWTMERVISLADEALYRAKQGGRNQVRGGPPEDRLQEAAR